MNTQRYAVKNAKTGELFAGFDADNNALWTDTKNNARAFASRLEAQCQANLFRRFEIPAQLKAVTL